MAGETTITIIGNLTAEPEVHTTNTGTHVVGFTIASTPRTFNRQTNQFEDGQALFIRCSAWRDMADHVAQTLHKGMRVIAQGRLEQNEYTDQQGNKRTSIQMQVDEIGPSLRYATAQVQRTTQQNNGYQQQGGYQQQAQAPQYGQQQTAPNIPGVGNDVWSQTQAAADFGGFGGGNGEPAF